VRAALLALLAERPMHGYEMIQELAGRTGGIWRPSPGSVYPILHLLLEQGLTIAEHAGGRKVFTLTATGRAAAAQAAAQSPWQSYPDTTVAQVREVQSAVAGLLTVLHQVGATGTAEQRSRALEVLAETASRLHGILTARQ